MQNTVQALLLSTLLVASATASASDYRLHPLVRDQIVASLTAQGYDVRRVKQDDGLYEAYVLKDGQRLELYLNDRLQIVREKRDD